MTDPFDLPPLCDLEPDLRQVLRLAFAESWPEARIAQFLRLSVRTVRRRKVEALRMLKMQPAELLRDLERSSGRLRTTVSIARQRTAVNASDTTFQQTLRLIYQPRETQE